jgi:hypothetical protein
VIWRLSTVGTGETRLQYPSEFPVASLVGREENAKASQLKPPMNTGRLATETMSSFAEQQRQAMGQFDYSAKVSPLPLLHTAWMTWKISGWCEI